MSITLRPRSIKEEYERRYREAINTMILVLVALRDQPHAPLDKKIAAVEVCMKHLPNVLRALYFLKNTNVPPPTDPAPLPPVSGAV